MKKVTIGSMGALFLILCLSAPVSAQLFGSSTTRQPMFPASQSLNGATIVASDWFSVSGSSSFSFYQTLTTSTAVPFITALGAIDSLDYSVRLSFHDSQSKPALADSGFVFAADTTNFILLRTITAHDTTRQGKKIYQLSTAQYEGTFRWVRAYFIKGSKILSKGTPTLNSQLDLVTIQ